MRDVIWDEECNLFWRWLAVEGGDAAGLQAYAEELRARFMRLQGDALALHERARAVRVTEKSRDGLVSATVGVRGDLVRLDIDPRVFRRPDARSLADVIVETVRRASVRAVDEVVEIFAPLVPAEQMRAHLDGDLETVLAQLAGQMLGEGGQR
ncbi:YbaB/EbfC family nucleoid-associated protein [Nonomuraea turkmeniaca]|uniref:YbaB/EbfC family nucleoid-associated protein n=1 Tax=Nonomuraea turkmeniaca TaxID=103838 RepID=A0A5S4EY13_9ACTN|nr:YbaB/EbfC family nucleoid-associated protein [Nonomuraea turkmeniaca]